MIFNEDFLRQYLMFGPMSLALYRSLECDILSKEPFERPILDIGCGDGHFAEILFKEEIDVGIDPQAREVAKAKKTRKYKELLVCSGDQIPKSSGYFKTIFSNSTFEHIQNIEPVLAEAARLLANDGRLLVTIPTDRLQKNSILVRVLRSCGAKKLAEKFEGYYNTFWQHYNALPEKKWEKLFDKIGLIIVDRQNYCPQSLVFWFDFLLMLALPAYILEKLTGRWILSRTLRQLYVSLPETFLASTITRNRNKGQGTLVFYSLSKKISN